MITKLKGSLHKGFEGRPIGYPQNATQIHWINTKVIQRAVRDLPTSNFA